MLFSLLLVLQTLVCSPYTSSNMANQYSTPIPRTQYSTAQTIPANTYWGQSTPQGYQYKLTPSSSTYQIPAYNSSPQTPQPTQIGGSTGSVLGASTGRDPHINPATGLWDDNYYQSQFNQGEAGAQLQAQVDSVYGDAYSNLDRQEASVRAGEQDLYTQFSAPYDAQRPLLDQALKEGQTLNTQQQGASKQQEANALSAAKRLYQELSQGVQQRFGGGNSASDFAKAFFGREFQKNMGNIQNVAGQNMQKLLDQATNIQNDYNSKIQQLNKEKEGALAQARNVFNEKLAAINSARFGLDQNKAQLKLQALQELRANVQNVLANAMELEQRVQSSLQQGQAQLAAQVQAYRAQTGQAVDLSAVPNAYYSTFGRQSAYNPAALLSNVYGYRREDERKV